MTPENTQVSKGFFVMPVPRQHLHLPLNWVKASGAFRRKCSTLPSVLLLLWSCTVLHSFRCSSDDLTYFTVNESTSIDVEADGCGTTFHLVDFFFFLSFVGTHFIRDSSLAGDGHAFGVLVKTHSTAILFCVCQIVNWNDEEARLIFLQARTFESPIPYVLSHNAKIVIVTFFSPTTMGVVIGSRRIWIFFVLH